MAKWESLADPVVLAQQMWNHGAANARGLRREEAGLAADLRRRNSPTCWCTCRTCPRPRHLATNFAFPPSDSGEALFQSKGCAGCHTGKLALEGLLRNQTLTDIAADMWNHQPSMKQPPPALSQEEMRQIIGYIWARQYFRGNGNAERGKKVFAEKNCATCHNDPSSGAPKLAKGKDAYSDITHGGRPVGARPPHVGPDEPEEARLAAVHGAADVGPDRVSEFAVTAKNHWWQDRRRYCPIR